jgi:hypothetical protein
MRLHGNGPGHRTGKTFGAVPRQAGHEMDADLKPVGLEQLHGGVHIPGGMSPFGTLQNFVHEGLGADLHDLNAIPFQEIQSFLVYTIGSRGYAEGVNRSRFKEGLRIFQQAGLILPGHPRKIAAVEGNLHLVRLFFDVSQMGKDSLAEERL